MDRMSALDSGFYFAESENTPMHVGSVAVFEGPAPSYGDVVRLLRNLAEESEGERVQGALRMIRDENRMMAPSYDTRAPRAGDSDWGLRSRCDATSEVGTASLSSPSATGVSASGLGVVVGVLARPESATRQAFDARAGGRRGRGGGRRRLPPSSIRSWKPTISRTTATRSGSASECSCRPRTRTATSA